MTAAPPEWPRAPEQSRLSDWDPGDVDWMTPQCLSELAAATDLIGYGPYLDRVPIRPGQRRHALR